METKPVETYSPDTTQPIQGQERIINERSVSEKTASTKAIEPSFKNKLLLSFFGELCGTFMFLWTAYIIAQAANHDYIAAVATASTEYPNTLSAAKVLVIALGFGFGVSIAITVFGPISGGNLNPAVTLTLMLTRNVNLITGAVMIVAQILAAMAAAAAVSAMTPGKILFANSLGLETSKSQGVFIEAFGTFLLCITVLFTAIEHGTLHIHLNSIAIGLSLLMAHLVCIPFTGAGVNPARSFGPCVAGRDFPVYHWIYWVGPILGAAFSALIYTLFKFLARKNPVVQQEIEFVQQV